MKSTSGILFLDIETSRDGRLFQVGAVLDDRQFRWHADKPKSGALTPELDDFARDATAVAGHNLLEHDLPVLDRLFPGLAISKLPAIDTLLLSPLAFPANPYHRLVKDYKLVRDTVNDPVADAALARRLFEEQIEAFQAQSPDLLALYGYCFAGSDLGHGAGPAMAGVFAGLSGRVLTRPAEALSAWLGLGGELACGSALRRLTASSFGEAGRLLPLAYALVWLHVAGDDSVLPPWVRRRVPRVVELLKALRDKACGDPHCVYCRHIHDALPLLKRHFDYDAFRPEPAAPDGASLQQRIVEAGMRDESLLAILPTGGGKSLCFQLPALARFARRGTLTIVVSPLQALMKDQVENLERKTGSTAGAALYGLLTQPERMAALERIRLGGVGLLYLSPEQLRNRSTRAALAQREIGCWVFDEAHCLSKWGHDFRPDYLYAARFIKEEAPAPVACYTATAKTEVITEIRDVFRAELNQELTLFQGGVERPNLGFSVHSVVEREKVEAILGLLAAHLQPDDPASCAIVYCRTRRRTQEMAEVLIRHGWSADYFHGDRKPADKIAVQEGFAAGRLQVVCATNAFGMGIDKDCVRLVVHADIPGSLENYLQEAGRAGRDRQPAHCALLYATRDVDEQFKLTARSELTHRDIVQILRGIRAAAKRIGRTEVVLTAGELLGEDGVETSFEARDAMADTKVKSAVAWLEKADLVERNLNDTRVAPGRPLLDSMTAFEARTAKLGLADKALRRWREIYRTLIAAVADPDMEQSLSTDHLAYLPSVREDDKAAEDASHRVLTILGEMATHGLVDGGSALTALVKPIGLMKTLEQLQAMEADLVDLLREAAPEGERIQIGLRLASQKLRSLGHESGTPEVVRRILKTLDQGERSTLGWLSRVKLLPIGQGHFWLSLLGDWREVVDAMRRRHALGSRLLAALTDKTRGGDGRLAQAVVKFTLEELTRVVKDDIALAAELSDPMASVQSVLITLHDWKVITLQQGLAIFRQAMTIDLPQAAGRRQYTQTNYEPLARHYEARTLQIHVMERYACLGLADIHAAQTFASDYFSLTEAAFAARHLRGRETDFGRPLRTEMFARIVTDLRNAGQQAIVTAPADRNVLVLAGPGSGKTRVIVHRAAYLLRVQRVAPRALLILCFNRSAALSIRQRLRDLIGDEAAQVDVYTYHALAMRLMGASFEGVARGEEFDKALASVIPDAVAMLTGQRIVPGLDADEVRDHLLSHYRYLLIDEYQDINADQYDLVSAVAGRTESDADARIALMAVGDDDQALYGFLGADVGFIGRFEADYGAQRHYLVENFRSSRAIIAAANALIAHNGTRMKHDHPISIDHARANEAAGGAWQGLDPVAQGRVQILKVADAAHQVIAVLDEFRRMTTLDPDIEPSKVALLAPTHEDLRLLQMFCARQGLPVTIGSEAPGFSLVRLREVRVLLDLVKSDGDLSHSAATEMIAREALARPSPWWSLVDFLLAEWRFTLGEGPCATGVVRELLYESLTQMRRDRPPGQGLYLSTLHGAKGLEFPHVFLLDGHWAKGKNIAEQEELRRLFYVGMTRARQTLTIIERQDARHPLLAHLADRTVKRVAPGDGKSVQPLAEQRACVLSLEHLFLDYAGRRAPDSMVHRRIAALRPGDALMLAFPPKRPAELRTMDGEVVGLLSAKGTLHWRDLSASLRKVRLHAVIRRFPEDSKELFRDRLRVESYDVLIPEVWWQAAPASGANSIQEAMPAWRSPPRSEASS